MLLTFFFFCLCERNENVLFSLRPASEAIGRRSERKLQITYFQFIHFYKYTSHINTFTGSVTTWLSIDRSRRSPPTECPSVGSNCRGRPHFEAEWGKAEWVTRTVNWLSVFTRFRNNYFNNYVKYNYFTL